MSVVPIRRRAPILKPVVQFCIVALCRVPRMFTAAVRAITATDTTREATCPIGTIWDRYSENATASVARDPLAMTKKLAHPNRNAVSGPNASRMNTYIPPAAGPLTAFLFGWTSFFVIASGSLATLAVAFSLYLSQIVPMGHVASRVVSVAVIALTAAVNIRGTRHSATMQNWTTGFKIGALLLMGTTLIAFGHPPATTIPAWPSSVSPSLLTGFGTAMIGVLWAYEGWQYVTFSAGDTIDPQRTFPRAITVATAVLVVTYLLASYGYVAALGPAAAAHSEHIAADAVSALLGTAAGKLVGALILVSIFSATNGLMLTAPRVYFAMARDRVFFNRVGVS